MSTCTSDWRTWTTSQIAEELEAVVKLGCSEALSGWVRPQGSRCTSSSSQVRRTWAATSLFSGKGHHPALWLSLKHRGRARTHAGGPAAEGASEWKSRLLCPNTTLPLHTQRKQTRQQRRLLFSTTSCDWLGRWLEEKKKPSAIKAVRRPPARRRVAASTLT